MFAHSPRSFESRLFNSASASCRIVSYASCRSTKIWGLELQYLSNASRWSTRQRAPSCPARTVAARGWSVINTNSPKNSPTSNTQTALLCVVQTTVCQTEQQASKSVRADSEPRQVSFPFQTCLSDASYQCVHTDQVSCSTASQVSCRLVVCGQGQSTF